MKIATKMAETERHHVNSELKHDSTNSIFVGFIQSDI